MPWGRTVASRAEQASMAAGRDRLRGMTPRDELDLRLLAEARQREQSRHFRRVFSIIAFAVLMVVIGLNTEEQMLAFVVAGLLVVAAVVIAVRGR